MKKFLLPIIALFLFFTATSYGQSLVPIANFPTRVLQTKAFGDYLYFVTRGSNWLEGSLYGYDIKGSSAPKLIVEKIDIQNFDVSTYLHFVEAKGKLYLFTSRNGLSVHLHEVSGLTLKSVKNMGDGVVTNAVVTENENKIFLTTLNTNEPLSERIQMHCYDFAKKQKQTVLKGRYSISQTGASLGDDFFFGHADASRDMELWKSDGTTSGTKMLADINTTSSSSPRAFFRFNKRVYFSARTSSNTLVHWTDGTTVKQLKDPISGKGLSSIYYYGATKDYAIVGNFYSGLYTFDKAGNTHTLTANYFSAVNVVDDDIYYGGTEFDKISLYKSDGTSSGTILVSKMGSDVSPSSITQIIANGKSVIFNHKAQGKYSNLNSIWRSDGTEKGTERMLDSVIFNWNDSTLTRTRSTHLLSYKNQVYVMNGPDSFFTISRLSNRSSKVKVLAFLDQNENGLKDAQESEISGAELDLSPGGLKLRLNDVGESEINLDPGKYTITSPLLDNDWGISNSTKDELEFQIPNKSSTVKLVYLPLSPEKDVHETEARLAASRQRCNSDVPYWINIRNTGTLTSDIKVKLVYDSKVRFVSSKVKPTKVDTLNRTVEWEWPDLTALNSERIKFIAALPGVESLGDSLKYEVFVETLEGSELKDADTIVVEDPVFCSYDPNDKQVWPNREDSAIYRGEKLTYKIRFQNSGNDTAYNVKIVDTLSGNLDLTTFKILGTSHSMESRLNDVGVITFYFDDIYLVDSNTNEPESHGFIDYEVYPKTELSFGDRVENTAYIYFDFNPAIVTNTTMSVLGKPSGRAEVLKVDEIGLFPNPFSDELVLGFEKVGNRQIEVTNVLGAQVYQTRSSGDQLKLNTSAWTSGVHLITVSVGSNQAILRVIKE